MPQQTILEPGRPRADSGAESHAIDFCTLGMFIIDEIHFRPPKPPVFNILGGAGSYSALGARILSPAPQSKAIGWIVDAGHDFPLELRETIAAWETNCLLRETPERPTTRGGNGYGEQEQRAFKYTTPKLRLDHNSLSEDLLLSRSFHIISSPKRCVDLIRGILERRKGYADSRPIFLWEPVPDLCVPEEHENCKETLRHVDVVSPNHIELCGFFGLDGNLDSSEVNVAAIEECSQSWLDSGIGPDAQGLLVVRAGAEGCLVASKGERKWMKAYHSDPDRVIDPTGGGNAFLGGLGVCLARGAASKDLTLNEEAVAWGTIAASFAIEQVGMPVLNGSGCAETWNGVNAVDRLVEYKRGLRC